MAVIPIRAARRGARGDPANQLYRAVLDALAAWSDQQADSFAGDAVYALSREDLIALARQYVS